MINLIIFLISFFTWVILVINRVFNIYTHILAFIWGVFLAKKNHMVMWIPDIN